MEEGKAKCHIKLKKSEQKSSTRKRKTLDVFEGLHGSHDDGKDKNETEERTAAKAQKIRGIKNGQIITEPRDDLEKQTHSATSHFIRSLQEKLERVQNKKKIVYLNFPQKGGAGLSERQPDGELVRVSTPDGKKRGGSRTEEGGPDELSAGSAGSAGSADGVEPSDHSQGEDSSGLAADDSELAADFPQGLKQQNEARKYPISEESLTYKRKLFLEKFHKNEKESIFKNEMSMYTDFDDHHIQVENYGKRILRKMGFDEEAYNRYINQYYQERSDKNYFDRIYESFEAREFRFTGVGAEGEMKENMQRIRGRSGSSGGSGSKGRSESRSESRTGRTNRRSGFSERNDKPHDHPQRSKGKGERREEARCADPRPRDNTDDLFEGLIVKINLKTHEFYKRKGVILYRGWRRRRGVETKGRTTGGGADETRCVLGLLLFKSHKYIHLYKEMIKEKIKDYLSWKGDRGGKKQTGDDPIRDDPRVEDRQHERKQFWELFLKRLIKKVERDRKDDHGERNNKSKQPFHLTEVKPKYVETSISEDTVKCKVVRRGVCHPKGDTSLYKQTVKLKKINGDCAHVQVEGGHLLRLSLDDVCQYISHV
ncbi:conserved Plasmodium protein, unknown function [Plasmodium vivax]|uniref:Uncharacterized protein n=1 Tax=Plasmodium vivax TaxID=5855 RepID=A0A564ZUI6_PLAVI|nr:conserved Plasmodium protein, unknown function [Plasmodium vivax]